MHVRAAPGALLAALAGCSDGRGPPAAATAASASAAPAPVATTGTIRGVVTFAGRHAVEAWHSQFGRLTREDVEVPRGGEVAVKFEYTDQMTEPDRNKGELVGLW